MSSRKIKYVHIVWIIAFAAFINFIMLYRGGIINAPDSIFYHAQAEAILSKGIMHYADEIATPYYWGYPSFIALVNLFHGGDKAIILLQILLAIVANVLLYNIIYKVIRNYWTAVFCCTMYCVLIDVFWWNRYVLSDCLGMIMEIVCLYFFCQVYLNEDTATVNKVLFWITLLLFSTTRTNSFSLILVLIIAMIWKETEKSPKMRRTIFGLFLVLIIVVIVTLFLISSLNPRYGLETYLDLFRREYESGIVIDGRPSYDYDIQGEFKILDFVAITLIRVKCYFSIWFDEFSLGHKIVNLFTLLPVWLLSIFSSVCIIRDKKREYYPFMFGILSYFTFQIFTIIDFDLRYRSPIFALLLIICSYGANKIGRFIKGYLLKKSDSGGDFI